MSTLSILLLTLLACQPKGDDDSGAPMDGGATDGGGDAGTDGGGDGGGTDGGTDGGTGGGDGTPYVGMAFALDLEGATWTAPTGLGDAFFGDTQPDLLIEVLAAFEGSIDLRQGWTEDALATQDACAQTAELVAPTLGLPALATEPATLLLPWGEEWYPLLQATVTGTLPEAPGDPLADWSVQGLVDLRTWALAFAPLIGTDDPDELAEVFAGFGATAQACPTDEVELCVGLSFEDALAPAWEGPLTPRGAEEIAKDEACR